MVAADALVVASCSLDQTTGSALISTIAGALGRSTTELRWLAGDPKTYATSNRCASLATGPSWIGATVGLVVVRGNSRRNRLLEECSIPVLGGIN